MFNFFFCKKRNPTERKTSTILEAKQVTLLTTPTQGVALPNNHPTRNTKSKPAVSANKNSIKASYFDYIPGKNWFGTQIGNLVNLLRTGTIPDHFQNAINQLPRIGITGHGITINGFVFDLTNIPKNLKNNLNFLLYSCLLINTKADSVAYFTDPTNSSVYKIDASRANSCHRENFIEEVLNFCNASSATLPYPTNFDSLATVEDCGNPGGGVGFYASFYRALGYNMQAIFESCITDAMKSAATEYSAETNKMTEIVLGSAAGVALLCFIGCNYRYFYEKCRAPAPVARELSLQQPANVPFLSMNIG